MPLFSDDDNDHCNSHKHNQELLLGNNINRNNNNVLPVLQESCVNDGVWRTTTTGGNHNDDAKVEDATNGIGDMGNMIAQCVEIVSLERNRAGRIKKQRWKQSNVKQPKLQSAIFGNLIVKIIV